MVAALALSLSTGASAAQISFSEQAIQRGVVYTVATTPGFAGYGVGLVDLDADGDLDLVVTGSSSWRVGVFENNGQGFFTDRSLTCGLPVMTNAINFAATDLDGDRLPELIVVGYLRKPVIFRNLGGISFVDITATTGIDTLAITAGVTSGDYDGDGHIDLFLSHYAFPIPGVNARNQLWRSQGNGTFVNVAPMLGLDNKSYTLDAAFFDSDEDGDLDLYISNDRGMLAPFEPNRFHKNIGGTFQEIGQQNGTGLPFFSMGIAIGDFTGNGITDLYCTNSPGNFPPLFGKFPLFLGTDSGVYVQGQSLWGVGHYGVGWACIFFDANCSGRRDLFVASSSHPPTLYQNLGAPPAFDATATSGIQSNMGPSYGAAVGDVNGDGRLDLVVNPLGSNVRLYINQSNPAASWSMLRIVGEGRDTAALGATVRLTAGGVTQLGHVLQGGNGYLGQNGFDVHFGLGSTQSIDSIVVRWPNTGTMRTLTNYAVKQRWTIHPPDVLGDINGDGEFTQSDLSALVQFCGSMVTPGHEILDMNGDGVIGAADVPLLVAKMTGEIGDFVENGVVDGEDLGVLLQAWGHQCSPQDLNGDGVVDGADLGILLGRWGGG